ncbi:MAG: hypothetical protein DRH04_09055, partial [Deltaproteobacteria bacterium]
EFAASSSPAASDGGKLVMALGLGEWLLQLHSALFARGPPRSRIMPGLRGQQGLDETRYARGPLRGGRGSRQSLWAKRRGGPDGLGTLGLTFYPTQHYK